MHRVGYEYGVIGFDSAEVLGKRQCRETKDRGGDTIRGLNEREKSYVSVVQSSRRFYRNGNSIIPSPRPLVPAR